MAILRSGALFAASLIWGASFSTGCSDAAGEKEEAGGGMQEQAFSSTDARVVDEQVVAPRTRDLTIASPALGGTAKVRLLLPKGWEESEHTWPVLYLLHGCCGDYTSWTSMTDVAALTENAGLIVVMPEAGRAGFYSNWWNGDQGGPPGWETFHLSELRRILERDYRAGHRRAIAGLSMGGFGAISYAARHRGMFRAAAEFSGIVHTLAEGGPALVQGIVSHEVGDPLALWGDPSAQRAIWQAHNPYDLADRLIGIPLYLACGNGKPGPLDPPGRPDDGLERQLEGMNAEFVQRMRGAGANVTANLYGPGTHTWPYWERELHASFPMLTKAVMAP
ncbi:esterase family protein [Pendulispora brunnea]|uniref:Esterase family protein n=1 Tax=Pendulispora brunnea TaxID=2905690 RepID=A0ABZ2JZA4_9BACT